MGNLISGNGDYGVYLGTGASGNTVQGNRIGTDADGLTAIANVDGGVVLIDGVHDNAIGGSRALGLGNLISGNDESGVLLIGADTSGNVVAGNLVGTDASGAAVLGNGGDGVLILSGARDNTIGGLVASEANTISANGSNGVYVGGTGSDANHVVGNRIGTTLAGDGPLANTFSGVAVGDGARDTEIGGARATGAGNLISGNRFNGVLVSDPGTSGTRIEGNLIGTDASGTARLGNGADGVHVERAAGTRIGGAAAGLGNVISANSGDGVRVGGAGAVGTVIEGNRIGTGPGGTLDLGNDGAGVRLEDGAEATRVGTAAAGNVISGNGGEGIVVDGGGAVATRDNVVEGNLVGTDADGTAPLGNAGDGIVVTGGAIGTRVGGLAGLGQGNVVAAGTAVVGIRVDGVDTSGTRVSGNLVGTDRTGDVALANLVGIEIRDTIGTVVGGGIDGQGNVVSGNLGVGVHVLGSASVGVHVVGNLIGTTANGTGPLGNGSHGVLVGAGARQTTIGGAAAAQRNVVSANGGHGIAIAGALDTRVDGNVVGTSADGTTDLGNDGNGVTISDGATSTRIGGDLSGAAAGTANLISANVGAGIAVLGAATGDNAFLGNVLERNGGLGIDLNGDGVDAAREPDADPGANGGIGRPIIARVGTDENGRVEIQAVIETTSDTPVRVDVYATGAPDPSGHGGAQRHLGSVAATTDGQGTCRWSAGGERPAARGRERHGDADALEHRRHAGRDERVRRERRCTRDQFRARRHERHVRCARERRARRHRRGERRERRRARVLDRRGGGRHALHDRRGERCARLRRRAGRGGAERCRRRRRARAARVRQRRLPVERA